VSNADRVPVALEDLTIAGAFDTPGWDYGTNFVFLGYLPGLEAMYAGLYADFQAQVQNDYLGTPIEDIPLVAGIQDQADFDANFDNWEQPDLYARQWPGNPPDRPTLYFCGQFVYGAASVFYPVYINAMVVGMPAPLEQSLGYLGKATASSDAQTGALILWMGVLFFAQYDEYIRKKKRV
jgi:hypothetical protein